MASQKVLVVKNLPAKAGDVGSTPGSGTSPGDGQGHGNPLQYSCQENSMDSRAWQAMVYRVAKCQTWLKRLSTYFLKIQNWLLRKRITDLENELIVAGGGGVGIVRDFGKVMYTLQLLYLKWITNKDLAYSTWSYTQCHELIWIGVGFEWQFSSVQLLSCVRLFATPWTAECQASLSITNSQSLLKLTSIELVMPHLIFPHPLLLLSSIFPSIRVFSNESVLHISWPKVLEFQLQHQSLQ